MDNFQKDPDASRLDASFSEFIDPKYPTLAGISNLGASQDILGDNNSMDNTAVYKIDDANDHEFPRVSGKVMEEERTELLESGGRRGWRNLSSLERALSIALGLVSALAVALMIAVIVVGVQLNKDDYKAVPKVTTTLLPPWVTTIQTTPTPDVTTRVRPTWPPSTTPMSSWGTCMTTECFKVAGEIMLSLDQTVSPCDDFYMHACGGWMTNNPTTDDGLVITRLSKTKEKFYVDIKRILESDNVPGSDGGLSLAKEVYSTCILPDDGNSDSHAADLNLFLEENIGNLTENAMTIMSLYKVMGSLRRDLGANYIVSLTIDSDMNDRDKNSIYLDKPEIGINPLSFDTQDEVLDYKDLIVEMWTTIYPEIVLDDAQKIADDIIQFEMDLLQLIQNRTESNSIETYDVEFGDRESDTFANGIETDPESWRVFVSEVFRETVSACNVTGTGDCEIASVVLNDPEFLQDIESLLNNSDYTTIGNYLRWRIIQDFARDSDEKFYIPFRQFEESILGYPKPTVYSIRWKYCLSQVLNFFPTVITEEYSKRSIQDFQSFREGVNSIAESVLLSFYNMTENLPWIAMNETINIITNDLDNTRIIMSGILSELDMDINSTDFYSGLNLTDSSSGLQNIFDLTKWKSLVELSTVFGSLEMNRMAQSLDAQRRLNVQFSPLSDAIYLPLGILQPPTFRELGTNLISLNYGSLGTMIGRSLVEVLRNSAEKYVNGSRITTWDEQSTLNYQNATECLTPEDSFDTVTEDEQMPSEVIASHLAGIKSAFNAYKLDNRIQFPNQLLPGLSYTPEQMFFLGYAQTMCRNYPQGKTASQKSKASFGISSAVREALENSKEFQSSWECSLSNDEDVCSLW